MIEKVANILSELKESPELAVQIHEDTSIVNDLAIDSLQLINFILAVEDAFDVQIDFDEFNFEHLYSVGTFCSFIADELAKQGKAEVAQQGG